MDDNEIRAEIQRQKKRAEDLRIREVLQFLHNNFRFSADWKRDDPEWLYPGIEEGSSFADNRAEFRIGHAKFELIYKEHEVSDRSDSEQKTVDGTFGLVANQEKVFDFGIRETTTYARFEPIFDEHLGEITRFIDGPWVDEIIGLSKAIKAHRESVQQRRKSIRDAKELEATRKRFGL